MSTLRLSHPETDPATDEEPIPLTRPRAHGASVPPTEGTLFPGLKLVVVAAAALLPRALSKRLAAFDIEVVPRSPASAAAIDREYNDATVIVLDRYLDEAAVNLDRLRGPRNGLAPVITCDLADAVASQEGLRELVQSLEPAVVAERRLREALQTNRAVRVPIGVLRTPQLLRVALDTSPWTIRCTIGSAGIRIDTIGQQLAVREESSDTAIDTDRGDQLLHAFLALRHGEALFQRRTSEVVPAGTAAIDTGPPPEPPTGVRSTVEPEARRKPPTTAPRRTPKPTLVGLATTSPREAPDRSQPAPERPTPEEERMPGIVTAAPARTPGRASHKPTETLWEPGAKTDPLSGLHPRPRARGDESGSIRVDRTGRRSLPAYGPQSELVRQRESAATVGATPEHTRQADPPWWEAETHDLLDEDEPVSPLALSTAYRVVRGFVISVLLLGLCAAGVAAYFFTR